MSGKSCHSFGVFLIGSACLIGFIWLVHGEVRKYLEDPTSVAVEYKTTRRQKVKERNLYSEI